MSLTNILLIIIIIILAPGLVAALGMAGLIIAIPVLIIVGWHSIFKSAEEAKQKKTEANEKDERIKIIPVPFNVTLNGTHQRYSKGGWPIKDKIYDNVKIQITELKLENDILKGSFIDDGRIVWIELYNVIFKNDYLYGGNSHGRNLTREEIKTIDNEKSRKYIDQFSRFKDGRDIN